MIVCTMSAIAGYGRDAAHAASMLTLDRYASNAVQK